MSSGSGLWVGDVAVVVGVRAWAVDGSIVVLGGAYGGGCVGGRGLGVLVLVCWGSGVLLVWTPVSVVGGWTRRLRAMVAVRSVSEAPVWVDEVV